MSEMVHLLPLVVLLALEWTEEGVAVVSGRQAYEWLF
jgi:hypothetical protein